MSQFPREQFNNLSIQVKKSQLNDIVQEVNERSYGVFWGFDRGKMILTIHNTDLKNKLTFVRHKRYMELISVDILSVEVLDILDRVIDYTKQVKELKEREVRTKKVVQYHEIDYYLSELHEYLVQGDRSKVNETKAILKNLLINGVQLN
ncbi:hypothetical protein M3689_03120 [Alkalihalophilus marmarensis]|jgi:hypothetical protein|uniref:Uncharacterized protein n=1 Tax=Alkalihalophilus marmarensis DSM 21297 TaxID=1188261 RepID=U6SRE3_9BACI|nr:hypothetical protein [Alkalihalophilus marmarensis]ERN54289.1 hypothetical protein A33I_07635 [Alkalihalophilus marmarensis DSM 21297]MCM3488293.1 hypothetical protein [Alkalihalophilus marmarensis]